MLERGAQKESNRAWHLLRSREQEDAVGRRLDVHS